jgi:hypothetical protein
MQTRISPTLTANPILTLEDLGLERSVGAERSKAQIVRWVQFPADALFFSLLKSRALFRLSLANRPECSENRHRPEGTNTRVPARQASETSSGQPGRAARVFR